MGLVFLTIAREMCLGQAKSNTGCLSYESTVVKLEGTLIRKTFPGPPNYESVRRGDKPEIFWLLALLHPVCIEPGEDSDLDPAQKDIRTIQLVVSPDVYKTQRNLVGKRVMVSGTLFGAHNTHHRTPALLTVKSITNAE